MGIHNGMLRQNVTCFHKMWGVMEQTTQISKFLEWAIPASFMTTCAVCGIALDNEIRLLNHMMEKHGFRNSNAGKPDRNSRGY